MTRGLVWSGLGVGWIAVAVVGFQAAGVSSPAAPAAPGAAGAARHADVLLAGVPHVEQLPDFCGEACVEMWLRKLGHGVDQRAVFDLTGVAPQEGRGAWTRDLVRALRALGLDPGPVWAKVPAAAQSPALEAEWAALHADLRAGVPSIVCLRTSEGPGANEHFRLVLGYDAAADAVVYHEPAEARGAYRRMPRERFLALWPLPYDRAHWTVVRLRLAPPDAGVQVPAEATGPRPADYAQRVMALRARLGPDFTIVVEEPFVVVGDEAPAVVRKRATGTVRWAADRLEAKLFDRRPDEIIDVFLFRDDASYRRHARALFGHDPHTPYGYSSPDHHALVMNIATGGGTLVHEMVHPYVQADFPACPAWLNEGLGSLYEQCGEEEGEIHGYPNWRLAGLQEAVREGRVPPTRRLVHTSTREFYDEDPGTNYAQARYLCYWLQQKGLLARFYREFRAARGSDPSGWKTLRRVAGIEDPAAFDRAWQEWVLTLRFP
jgi:hypothetical protein